MGLNTQPIKAITKIPDLGLKSKELKEAFAVMMRATQQEVSGMAVDALKASIALKGAIGTGTLLKSIYRRFLPNQSGSQALISNIGFQKPASNYAYFANYGRPAGQMPPYAEIEKWATAIGNPDPKFIWGVMGKIAAEGTEDEPHLFVEDAEQKIEALKPFIVSRNIQEFLRRVR